MLLSTSGAAEFETIHLKLIRIDYVAKTIGISLKICQNSTRGIISYVASLLVHKPLLKVEAKTFQTGIWALRSLLTVCRPTGYQYVSVGLKRYQIVPDRTRSYQQDSKGTRSYQIVLFTTIPVVSKVVWPTENHEPLMCAFFFTLHRDSPWRHRDSARVKGVLKRLSPMWEVGDDAPVLPTTG